MDVALPLGEVDAQAALQKFGAFLDEHPEIGAVWALDAGDTLIREMKKRYARTKRGREAQPLRTFSAWCDAQPDKDNLLPEDHPVFRWASSMNLDEYFVYLGWKWFVREFGKNGPRRLHKQRDWLAHFDNSVRKRWGKLWWPDGNGFKLSADGQILAREFPDEERA